MMEDLNNSSQHKFSLERGGGHNAPPLDEEVIDSCRERESVFFKDVVSEKKMQTLELCCSVMFLLVENYFKTLQFYSPVSSPNLQI